MLNTQDILQTIRMIREENLDIRTVTMGISLFDCISDDRERLEQKIYDKITRSARDLVRVCEDLERTYGIPIVNKRISITPLSYVGSGLDSDGFVRLAHMLQKADSPFGIGKGGFPVAGLHPVIQHIGGNAAGKLQEEDEFAHLPVRKFSAVHGDDGNAAFLMGRHGAFKGHPVHKVQCFPFQII